MFYGQAAPILENQLSGENVHIFELMRGRLLFTRPMIFILITYFYTSPSPFSIIFHPIFLTINMKRSIAGKIIETSFKPGRKVSKRRLSKGNRKDENFFA